MVDFESYKYLENGVNHTERAKGVRIEGQALEMPMFQDKGENDQAKIHHESIGKRTEKIHAGW